MQQFINKFKGKINGVLSGIDRRVFRGALRGLNYGFWDPKIESLVANGMEQYLWQNEILFNN